MYMVTHQVDLWVLRFVDNKIVSCGLFLPAARYEQKVKNQMGHSVFDYKSSPKYV